jgi:hypothetical protein
MDIEHRGYRINDWCRTRGRSRRTAYRLLAEGKLKARKHGKSTIITAQSDQTWWDSLPEFQPQNPGGGR